MKKKLLITIYSFLFLNLFSVQAEPFSFYDTLMPADSELQEQIKTIQQVDKNLENKIIALRLKAKEDVSNKDAKIDLASFLLKKVYLQRDYPYDKNEELLLEAYDLLQNNYYLETTWGDIFSKAKDYENAISHYEAALILNPEGINTVGLCGIAYLNCSNYEEALTKFDLYLKKYPDDCKVLFDAGKCCFGLEDYEKTIEYCEKALEFCKSTGLKDEIEELVMKAKERVASTEGFTQDEDSRFVITFAGDSKEDLGDLTSDMLNDIYDDITRVLNFYPDVKINVKFYRTDDYYEKTSWGWSAAQTSGITVEVPLSSSYRNEDSVKGLLAHELTHAVINLKTNGYYAPTWVHEGLAQYLEYSTRYGSPETLRSDFESILQSDFIENDLYIPLNKIPSYMRSSGDKDVSRAYVASYIAIRCLVDNYGEQSIDKLLTAYGEGKGIKDAVKEATGISYEKFQNEYKGWAGNL